MNLYCPHLLPSVFLSACWDTPPALRAGDTPRADTPRQTSPWADTPQADTRHPPGQTPPISRRLLLWMVCILLECILVIASVRNRFSTICKIFKDNKIQVLFTMLLRKLAAFVPLFRCNNWKNTLPTLYFPLKVFTTLFFLKKKHPQGFSKTIFFSFCTPPQYQ